MEEGDALTSWPGWLERALAKSSAQLVTLVDFFLVGPPHQADGLTAELVVYARGYILAIPWIVWFLRVTWAAGTAECAALTAKSRSAG